MRWQEDKHRFAAGTLAAAQSQYAASFVTRRVMRHSRRESSPPGSARPTCGGLGAGAWHLPEAVVALTNC